MRRIFVEHRRDDTACGDSTNGDLHHANHGGCGYRTIDPHGEWDGFSFDIHGSGGCRNGCYQLREQYRGDCNSNGGASGEWVTAFCCRVERLGRQRIERGGQSRGDEPGAGDHADDSRVGGAGSGVAGDFRGGYRICSDDGDRREWQCAYDDLRERHASGCSADCGRRGEHGQPDLDGGERNAGWRNVGCCGGCGEQSTADRAHHDFALFSIYRNDDTYHCDSDWDELSSDINSIPWRNNLHSGHFADERSSSSNHLCEFHEIDLPAIGGGRGDITTTPCFGSEPNAGGRERAGGRTRDTPTDAHTGDHVSFSDAVRGWVGRDTNDDLRLQPLCRSPYGRYAIPEVKPHMRNALQILVFAGFFAGSYAPAQQLLSSINLEDHGWQHPTREQVKEMEYTQTRHIGFDDAGKVYVGFALKGGPKILKPGETNNLFRVLTVDPNKGAVTRELDFETQSRYRTGVDISANGSLIVTANDRVQFIGEDGRPKAVFGLPAPDLHTLGWGLFESASGKTLLASTTGSQGGFFFLNSETLSLESKCNQTSSQEYVPKTFTDLFKMNDVELGNSLQFELMRGPLCGKAETFWSVSGVYFEPILLDDSTLLEIHHRSPIIQVQRLSGQVLWTETWPKHFVPDLDNGVSKTRDGSRFAIIFTEERGGLPALDISSRPVTSSIRVYDSLTGKLVSAVRGGKSGVNEFVLSPAGDMLAIQLGHTVEFWKL